jgi:hypothetical protein
LERARYHVERARRQYSAVEPENRLVARTLEQAWEEALAEQTQLEAQFTRFRREQAQAPSPAELASIQNLAQDLPALWNAETTTREERQTIVRLLLERILVEVIDDSEQVRVECHWHGGNRTSHQVTRPVARMSALSTYSDLLARATELRNAGHNCGQIAVVLNQEGWRPAKRRDTFDAQMVGRLLRRARYATRKPRRRRAPIPRHSDEWTIPELAEFIGMPQSTLYNWVQRGRLRSRSVQTAAGRAILVHADPAQIAELRTIRTAPAPWPRLPPPATPSRNQNLDS